MKPLIRFGPLALIICAALSTGCSQKAKIDRYLTRGDKYFAAEQYDRAELEYLNVLRLDQTNRAAIRNLGAINFANEVPMRAAAFLNTIKAIDPGDVEIRAKLARIYLNAGAVKEAMAEANFVLEKQATNELALLVLVETAKGADIGELTQKIEGLRRMAGERAIFPVARGFLDLKQEELAVAETQFKRAVALEPGFGTAHWALGSYYLSQTNRALAEPYLLKAAELSPIRSPRRLAVANFKLQGGDAAGARSTIDELKKKAPDYIPAWIYSARVHLGEKKFGEALADLDRALARNPENYEALVLRGETYLAEGRFDKGVDAFDQLNNRYPKSAPAKFQLALACILNKDLARAIAALNQAVALAPEFREASLLLAELNVRRGEAALAIASLTEFLKKEPLSEKGYLTLAAAYQVSGRLEEAIGVYERGLEKIPQSVKVALNLGIALRQKGQEGAAKNVFETALQRTPDQPPLIIQLVDMDIRATNYQGAVNRVEEQIKKYPNEPEPLFLLARVKMAEKELRQAEPLLERVIELDPDRAAAYHLLARIYLESDRVAPALERLKGTLTRNPRDVAALGMIAMIHAQRGDQAQARETYERLLGIAPTSILALNNLANIYAETAGGLDKAYELARKAEQLRPNDPRIADTFAWILTRRGEYKLALNLLQGCVRELPDEAEVWSHLGMTLYLTGEEKGAGEALQKALQMSPDFPGRAEVEKCAAILKINPAGGDTGTRSLLEQRLTEQPVDVVALSRLAEVYKKQKTEERMIPLYEKAVAVHPKLALPMARLAQLYFERGTDQAQALELARRARNLEPEDPEVARLAAEVAYGSTDLKDQQWALTLLQESAQKRKGHAPTFYALGVSYYTQGRLAEAESALREALALDGTGPSSEATKLLLEMLPLTANPASAAQADHRLDQILKSDPNYIPALAARGLAMAPRDPSGAEAALEKVLARFPGFAPAIRMLALLTSNRPEDPKAFQHSSRAYELFPQDPDVAKALGVAVYHRKDFSRAVRLLSESARKRTDDAQLQFYLGMSHYQLKQKVETQAALGKAVQLQANAAFVAEAKKILAELN